MTAWGELLQLARLQEGIFSAKQAGELGLSPQFIHYHSAGGRLEKLQRGIYRVSDFPHGEHEDLVRHWLWAERQGVFSHDTALALHDLTDLLPSRIHLTVPISWQRRRRVTPRGLVLHFAGVPADDVGWFGPVPITTPLRTLVDVSEVLPLNVRQQAIDQARQRGLIGAEDASALKGIT